MLDLVAFGVHCAERPVTTGDPELREAAQRHPRGASPLNGDRTDDGRSTKSSPGASSLDRDAIAGQRVEGQDGLDRGDAATGDEDAQWMGG